MPKWTKKDYVMISIVLREAPLDDRLDTKDGDRDILVQAFADRLRQDNSNFDPSRFDAAVFRGEFYKTDRNPRHGGWTRQDYEMVADVLKNSIASDAAKAVVAQGFADRFWFDNSNFKPDRFFKRALGPDYKERTYNWDEYTRASYGDYTTPGNDPTMPGGGPPVYHGPEERYGGRRDVRVRGHTKRVK